MKLRTRIIIAFIILSICVFSICRLQYQINPGRCNNCARCIISCNQNAISYNETLQALQIQPELCNSCGNCLSECPRNAIIDIQNSAIIFGNVINHSTGFPIRDAEVIIDSLSVQTGLTGQYNFILHPGDYDITCTYQGFNDSIVYNYHIYENQIYRIDFELIPTTHTSDNLCQESKLFTYPNPVKDLSAISLHAPENIDLKSLNVSLYNLKGQMIQNVKTNKNRNNIELIFSSNNLRSGIYFLRFNCNRIQITKKIHIIK